MPQLVLPAPAKLNLHLEVLGRRADGFHDLEMVFQTLALADEVVVGWEPSAPALTTCVCDDPGIPGGPGNLAHRAAEAYRAAVGLPGTIDVLVRKRVPHGAGLGGGSSDAASVLLALDALHGRVLGPAGLAPLALALGSDVPFFLLGGTAHALGRGEVLTPLPAFAPRPITILMPPVVLPTPTVFKAMTEAERGPRPARGAAWAAAAVAATDPQPLLTNRLTDPAVRCCPAVGEVLAHLAGLGVPHLMSGSGAACFALGRIPVPSGWRGWHTAPGPGAGVALPG